MRKTPIKAKEIATSGAVLVALSALSWLASASFFAIGFGGSPFDNNPFDDLPFNRAHWVEDSAVSWGGARRAHRAQDIVPHLKVGDPKQSVDAMLEKNEGSPLASTPAMYYYPSREYASSPRFAPPTPQPWRFII